MEIKPINTERASGEIHAKLLVEKEYKKPTTAAVQTFIRPAFPNMTLGSAKVNNKRKKRKKCQD